MKVHIRHEQKEDKDSVFKVVHEAFKTDQNKDPDEPYLVDRLRSSDAFIPELSLVAEVEDVIAGHILLTKIKIINSHQKFDSLALAPVSVLPGYQRKGLGSMLINYAHERAKGLGHKSIVLLGHEQYYPKFGYEILAKYGISLPFDVPDENCMVIELEKGGLEGVRGVVQYPDAFNL